MKRWLGISLILLIFSGLQADPWGKDADLARSGANRPQRCPAPACCNTPILGAFAEVMIGYHNNVISPCDGPRSHYNPSSSYYTLESMRRYGFLQGWLMGCDRLLRENDEEWLYPKVLNGDGCMIKYDPVP